jgi:glyoxylase-like metal-dependent hydrolase (beta-lactamase superfamily II)
MLEGLENIGYAASDVTDVFLTHIHLDHAGAAGWWAQQGAKIHVHALGAPHLLNPEKLLASAGRLYGDNMESLWGEFLPVQADKLNILNDNQIYQVNGLEIRALDVPGHANHHMVFLIDNACFSGDISGIRLSPQKYLSLPMPPPEIHLKKWRESIQHIQSFQPQRIVPTHFGVYDDADWHLQAVLDGLDEVEEWMEEFLPPEPPIDVLRQQFIEFERKRSEKYGIPDDIAQAQQIANPSFMSADGLQRYWNKYLKSTEID